jgi:uncharacterized membrane protein
MKHFWREKWMLYLVLLLASGFTVAVWLARVMYSGEIIFFFLIWNLFLAWLPLLFATVVITFPGKHYVIWVMGFLWLIFFPNAPYLVTDLLHLWPRHPVPYWYDMMMLFSFALVGLLLGVTSLYLMHLSVMRQYGRVTGWLFVLAALYLAGLGVYIGRFLRWNSWDLLTNPLILAQDLWQTAVQPALLLRMGVVSGMLTAVLGCAYLLFVALPLLVRHSVVVGSGD